jgi:hypothetical protein
MLVLRVSRAAVIPAGWPSGCWVVVGTSAAVSAGRGRERLELLERGEELGRPRPGVLKVELRTAAREREPASDVQQPVTHALGFGSGEFGNPTVDIASDVPVPVSGISTATAISAGNGQACAVLAGVVGLVEAVRVGAS